MVGDGVGRKGRDFWGHVSLEDIWKMRLFGIPHLEYLKIPFLKKYLAE